MVTVITDRPTSLMMSPFPSFADTRRDLRAALIGALGGFVGTTSMSAAFLAGRRLGLVGRLPPKRITDRVFFRGTRRPRRGGTTAKALAASLHFGFGCAAGVPFGLLERRLPREANPVAVGMLFGTLIWAASYLGWAPALGLMPSVRRARLDRTVVTILAHWIFGATLGAVVGRLDRT